MQDVRSILDSQKSSHLVIPKASLSGNFLVEERLPINVDSYHNMGLYLAQPQLFDEAVREMTRLFSKMYLGDLVNSQLNPLGHIADVGDFVRYDNLPLYIEEIEGKKVGKLGFIDLEHMENEPSPEGLATLVRIFPFHLDIIKEEAKNLGMKIDDKCLEASALKGEKYLQVGFADHLGWLKQKGVSTDVNQQHFEVGPERIKELTDLAKDELLKLNQGVNAIFTRMDLLGTGPDKNFLKGNPNEIAREFANTITPMIVDNIKTQIENKRKKELEKIKGESMSGEELVSLRSPVIKRLELHKNAEQFLEESDQTKFRSFPSDVNLIAEQLAYVIIQELVKGGELFYFDPAYYTGGHDLCWLRY